MKILIMGNGSCGKTSLANVLNGAPFRSDQPATLGLGYAGKLGLQDSACWDASGDPFYYCLCKPAMANLDLAIYCYDASKHFDCNSRSKLIADVETKSPNVTIFYVATRSDMGTSGVIMGTPGKEHFCTSAKTGEGIQELKDAIHKLKNTTALSDKRYPPSFLDLFPSSEREENSTAQYYTGGGDCWPSL